MRIQDLLTKKGYTIINTPKSCRFDIFICKPIDGNITCVAIAEIRSREYAGNKRITLDYVSKNGYLITRDKLSTGLEASRLIGVPYYVIVNLLDENIFLLWKIDSLDFETKKCWTKKTCNGGYVERINCFLPISKSKRIELDSW